MAAGEYLPPLVTELKADVSGLRRGFDEAKAEAKKYKQSVDGLSGGFRGVKRDSTQAGKSVSDFDRLVGSKMKSSTSAVKTLRKEYDLLQDRIKTLTKEARRSGGDPDAGNALKTARKDLAKLTGIGTDLGIKLGDGFGKGIANAMTAAGPVIQSTLVVVLIAAAALAAPVMGAAIGAALTLGLGAGVIGIAAMILKDDKKIKKAWEKLTETTSEVFQRAAAPMKKPFLELLKWLRVEFVKLEPELKNLFSAAAPLVKPLGEGFFGILKNMLPGLTDALKNAEPIFKTLGENLPMIGTALGTMFKTITEGENGAALSEFLTDGIKVVTGFILVLGEFIGWLSTTYVEIKTKFSEIKKFFKELPGDIRKSIGNPSAWMGGLGAMIMDGLIGGIDSKTPAIGAAVRNAMKAGIAAGKKELKSKSPSLVYFKMGEDTADGYRLGVQHRTRQAVNAAAALVSPRTAAAVGSVPGRYMGNSHGEMTGTAYIYLDGRQIQQAGIKYAQRDKVRNTDTGWS